MSEPKTEAAEAIAEAVTEAIDEAVTAETVTDNEVTIAAIEADKEIAIAEIHADARVAEAEAYAAQNTESTPQWDMNLLVSTMQTMQETQLMILERLAQSPLSSPPTPETVTEEIAETIAETLTEPENGSTPQFTSDGTSETQTALIESGAEESLIPPLVEIGRGPVIKLV